jgi:EAL domain-containing protein (putative c-di-GMP-specific phosphodiesterase class I)
LAGPVRDYDAIVATDVPWWLLALAVAMTERWPVHGGIEPQRVVLEIAEAGVLAGGERRASNLRDLHRSGVRLALVGFGAGAASATPRYLRTLPIEVLKLPKQIVEGIASRDDDAASARLTIDLAAALGLTVIAEGIESSEQHAVLRRAGCGHGQGYLFAAPLEDERPWIRRAPPRLMRPVAEPAGEHPAD